MHRGSRGVSPQPSGSKPGVRRRQSGPGRSKTPTAEIERDAYRTPVAALQKPPSAEDESYSAENLRRIARSLSGTVIGSRPQNLAPSHSCDPSVSRPPSDTLPPPLPSCVTPAPLPCIPLLSLLYCRSLPPPPAPTSRPSPPAQHPPCRHHGPQLGALLLGTLRSWCKRPAAHSGCA
ncbi:extensin [Oreochromis niloticus]|uniref:extensin n=1 Tax=Oreochromis niloticus TaxID=8128 RepID=UPI000905400F|nr:extensin [Oreochromis niloticus]